MPPTAIATLPRCPACAAPLPPEAYNAPAPAACARCGCRRQVAVFPAQFADRRPAHATGAPAAEGDAACFHHPGKRAVTACDACGRFLCALCDVPLGSRHLCVACIESGARKGRHDTLMQAATQHDNVALGLALLPLPLVFPTLFTAPLSLYYVVRYWNVPLSLLPRGRTRFGVAAALSLAQVAAWAAGGLWLLRNW